MCKDEEIIVDDIILLLFISMLVGCLLKHINLNMKVPFTPLLLILGIILGCSEKYLSWVGDAVNVWNTINPHAILLIFLPPLIYESSMNADWHIFKREIWQILILAGFGVLISAFLTASCFKWVLGYDNFSFSEALMFGSILSATDPVAVVSLLKELGASPRFSILIEGESLFNDGTAMVLYEVLLEFVEEKNPSAGDVTITFLRLAGGAILLGILWGNIMAYCMKRLFNETILIITLTVSSSYLLFYAAEMADLKFSGVLSVVAFGLFMTMRGKTKIISFSESAVHEFWEFCGFLAETLIFIVSGIVVGDQVLWQDRDIGIKDWLLMLAFYVLLHVVRFVTIIILWPILKNLGYGLNFRQILILTYGGLRGAVGLALALLTGLIDDRNQDVRDMVLFHTAGIATLTILINGNTTGYLVKWLKLSSSSTIQKKMMGNILKNFILFTKDKIHELKEESNYRLCDWRQVKQMIHLEKIKKNVIKRNNLQISFKENEEGDLSKIEEEKIPISSEPQQNEGNIHDLKEGKEISKMMMMRM